MPRSKEAEDIRNAAIAWEQQRHTFSAMFTQDALYKFSEAMNTHTRAIVSALGIVDPNVWGALMELCQNAATMTEPKAKLYVDGIDRSNI